MDFTCQGCPNRALGCHATCEKYQSEKVAHDEKRKQKAAEFEYMAYYYARRERLSRIKKGASYANAQRRRFGW